MVFLLAILIGFVAGLRPMVALAVASLAAHAGWLRLEGTVLGFMGATAMVAVAVPLAGAEMLRDMLIGGHSRKQPLQFCARLVSGLICGAALGSSDGALIGGAFGGALGAACGTLAGFDFRAWLARLLGEDRMAALTENAVAIGAAALVMAVLA